MGCIPTPEVRAARKRVHELIDPYWKPDKAKRKALYARLSDELGWNYHTSKIRNIEEAERVYQAATAIINAHKVQG